MSEKPVNPVGRRDGHGHTGREPKRISASPQRAVTLIPA
jgi:hypothetical protein